VRWVEEALVAFDVDGFLTGVSEVGVSEAGDGYLARGALRGEPLDPARHALEVLVKGISYHGLRVERRGARWHAALVFDI
jgi:SHS2 domain-containing protein